MLRDVEPALWALLAASGLLLLAAAANLGGVLLATLSDRQGELAARRALGATRSGLTRQVLVEVLAPSLLAGVLGYFLAVALVRWMVGLIPYGYISAETLVSTDGGGLALSRTLALAGGLVVAPLGASALPSGAEGSWAALRSRPGAGAPSRSRLTAGLVAESTDPVALARGLIRALGQRGGVQSATVLGSARNAPGAEARRWPASIKQGA